MHAVTYLPSQFRWTPQQLVDAMSRDLADWSEAGHSLAAGPCANDSTPCRRLDHHRALRSYQPERSRFGLFRLR